MKNRPNLITLKKQMYYLLTQASITRPSLMLDSERALLAILQDDLELQAELSYTEYMTGEEQ